MVIQQVIFQLLLVQLILVLLVILAYLEGEVPLVAEDQSNLMEDLLPWVQEVILNFSLDPVIRQKVGQLLFPLGWEEQKQV